MMNPKQLLKPTMPFFDEDEEEEDPFEPNDDGLLEPIDEDDEDYYE